MCPGRHLDKRAARCCPAVICPVPEHTILGLNEDDYDPDVVEQQVFRELGYLVASGSILWTARQCYVECMFACCQLCAVMSKPSERAFKLAMGVIAWLRDHKDKGILYRSDKNAVPVGYYDAAHNQYTHS